MDSWHHRVSAQDKVLGSGTSFDLDFYTIAYHGDRALVEKHYVSRRSRRQRGILAFLARDADARRFAYANARVRKDTQNAEILHFVERCRARTGQLPKELVFGSRLTTYANLGKLHAMGIHFLRLRRRTARLIAALETLPAEA